jgi:cytochrome b involved in lipid metabolism
MTLEQRVISADELGAHASRGDCWTAIHGKVYDVTSFLDQHPGGAKVMLKYAGIDSSQAFDMVRIRPHISAQIVLSVLHSALSLM